MGDPQLASLLTQVECSYGLSFPVCVMLPGGILTGRVVSQRRFLEAFRKSTAARIREDRASPSAEKSASSEGRQADPKGRLDTPTHLHVLDAELIVPPYPRLIVLRLGFACVRFEYVSVWGIGAFKSPPG